MDNLADSMQVVQAHQALLCHDANEGHGDTLVIIALDNFEQVDSKDFKHHHEVLSMGTVMQEAVQKLDAVAVVARNVLQFFWLLFVVFLERVEPFGFHPVTGNLVQDFDFIKGGNQVVTGGPLDLERNISVVDYVLGQPHCRKVAPSKLLNNKIPINQHLTNMHGVVPAEFVIRHSFVFRRVRVFVAS